MDPMEALIVAAASLAAGELTEAAEALDSYRAWRRRGGYEPHDGDRRAGDLGRRLHCGCQGDGDGDGDKGTAALGDAVDLVLADVVRRATAMQQNGNGDEAYFSTH